jgi:DNA polymerase I-like protein with 3'-5' exonuclease and polymerase domains
MLDMFSDLPELHGPLTLDTETHDPHLKTRGAGWSYSREGANGGKVIGIAVHADNFHEYLPIGHTEGNLDPLKVKGWLSEQLVKDDKQPKIFFHAQYDVGWFKSEGIRISGDIQDVAFQAPLVDEHRPNYQLDRLGKDLLGEGKDEKLLAEAAKKLGVKNTKADNIKMHLMRVHPDIVGVYGRQDVALTRALWDYYNPIVEEEELQEVYRLECDLIPMLVDMRFRGIRIDIPQLEIEQRKLIAAESEARKFIDDKTGIKVGSWDNAAELSRVFDKLGIKYGLTEKTEQPSITADWLRSLGHPVADAILRGRKTNNIRSTFLENNLLNLQQDGRIFPNFNPLKRDDDSGGVLGKELKAGVRGALSGRFSSSQPNFQNFPSPEKDPELGLMVRQLILPEEGEYFHVMDYSSQEPRLTVHFAEITHCRKAAEMADRFRENPDTDLHDETRKMVAEVLEEWKDPKKRKPAKIINLGVAYGMGGGKLALSLGLPYTEAMFQKGDKEFHYLKAGPEAQELMAVFDNAAPFIKQLAKKAQNAVKDKGYIRTPVGRRFRFPREEDGRTYKFLNKALNRLIQGSAADMTKLALRDMYREGILPHGTVHDEIDISSSDPRMVARVKDIMESAMPLSIPIRVDVGSGVTWGAASQEKQGAENYQKFLAGEL